MAAWADVEQRGARTLGLSRRSARHSPAARRDPELEQTLGLMTRTGSVRMDEVSGIAVLPRMPGAVVYAPLGETPVDPDVALVAGAPDG